MKIKVYRSTLFFILVLMEIKLLESMQKIRIVTEQFSTVWIPDSPANRKTLIIFLRSLKDPDEKILFTHQELAKIVGSDNRQASDQHLKDFRNCGEDFLKTLIRKRKVDLDVLLAIESILILEPLIGIREICEKLESGEKQYIEAELFKEIFEDLEQTKNSNLSGSDISAIDPTAIKKMITPGILVSDISINLKMIILSMVLYYWGIPLSVLGTWFSVHKTTILRRIDGMTNCLYPIFQKQIIEKANTSLLLIDEKWLKIKGKWHYWFAVINENGVIIESKLLPSRGKNACIYLGLKLKQLNIIPKVIKTDGLVTYSYVAEILGAIHSICMFHHQQAVLPWLKKNFTDQIKISDLKKKMRRIFQTNYKRTVLRRVKHLKEEADELGISKWVSNLENNLEKLLPSIGSKKIPLTSNGVERLFRAFNRFYKTRSGFSTVASAKRGLDFIQLMYLFTIHPEKGCAPIEEIFQEADKTPLYKIVNNPLKYIFNVKTVKLDKEIANFDVKKLSQREL